MRALDIVHTPAPGSGFPYWPGFVRPVITVDHYCTTTLSILSTVHYYYITLLSTITTVHHCPAPHYDCAITQDSRATQEGVAPGGLQSYTSCVVLPTSYVLPHITYLTQFASHHIPHPFYPFLPHTFCLTVLTSHILP